MTAELAEDTMSVESLVEARVEKLEKAFQALSYGYQGMAAHTIELAGRVGMLEDAIEQIFAQVAEEEAEAGDDVPQV
jgi:hypothetical protein